ncbi:MAG: aminotransferase class III-fold pyridoxal phosphate-dependent enzyme [Planctomycetota bacterium]
MVTIAPEDFAALGGNAVDGDTAMILEPIQGIAGCRDQLERCVPARRARGDTEAHGAVMIADEVQCGMGRSGLPFAFESAGVLPDLVTTAKGLGGGFPVGALLCTEAMAEGLAIGSLGTTFGGGPLACAAILAVIETMSAPGFLDNVRERSEQIQDTCVVGPVESIQGQGLLLGLRCDRPVAGLLPGLRKRGILAGGAVIRTSCVLTPPLILEASTWTRWPPPWRTWGRTTCGVSSISATCPPPPSDACSRVPRICD